MVSVPHKMVRLERISGQCTSIFDYSLIVFHTCTSHSQLLTKLPAKHLYYLTYSDDYFHYIASGYTVHMCAVDVQYTCPVDVQYTCVQWMYSTHVCSGCTVHMCVVDVQYTCVQWMFCTVHMCAVDVQYTCLQWMFCTVQYMYTVCI